MSKPSIYSKTRSQLQRDLAQAGRNTRSLKQADVLPEFIEAGESDAKSMNDDIREESG